ncbi:MAG: hypothetical protein IKU82_06285 [Clostridia bacterium]|nr:hypothetical protein [Clostridia bacterium]
MGFLDNAINKTKEAVDAACKKTEEIIGEEKTQVDIIVLKTKCEKDYMKLGEIYYNILMSQGEIPAEEKALIDDIDQKKIEIAKLEKELEEKSK